MKLPEAQLATVYIVTYRRPTLLKRAIKSALSQNYKNFRVIVINDDPDDTSVHEIISVANDARISLFKPQRRRGPVGSFNIMFHDTISNWIALLEDDNWWNPNFLTDMIASLTANPDFDVAVGNERIWLETPQGDWLDTGENIWPFSDIQYHYATLMHLCERPLICNSSTVFRAPFDRFLIPNETNVAVSEHFRERVVPRSIIAHGTCNVNFARTINSVRNDQDIEWSLAQTILMSSLFFNLTQVARQNFAKDLWKKVDHFSSPRAVSLVFSGLFHPEAKELWLQAPPQSRARAILTLFRRPSLAYALTQVRKRWAESIEFLNNSPLTLELASDYCLQISAAIGARR